MPSTIKYVCSKCLLSGSSFRSWGHFSYKVGDQLLPLDRVTGICNDCNTITPVEILPSEHEYSTIISKSLSNGFRPESLDNKELRLYALSDRRSLARCLNCGGHDFEILPNVNYDRERERSQTPIRTELIHKNCGGRFYGNPFGPNLFMGDRLPKRYFSIEGIEINESVEL